jgi:hypothetical protein
VARRGGGNRSCNRAYRQEDSIIMRWLPVSSLFIVPVYILVLSVFAEVSTHRHTEQRVVPSSDSRRTVRVDKNELACFSHVAERAAAG